MNNSSNHSLRFSKSFFTLFCHQLLCILVFASSASSSYAQTYTVTDIGTLGGENAIPQAINNRGDIVGVSNTAQGNAQAFLWHNGKIAALPNNGAVGSVATAINENGIIVGSIGNLSGQSQSRRAVKWKNSKLILLPNKNRQFSFATNINNSGDIAVTASNLYRSIFSWKGGTGDPFTYVVRGTGIQMLPFLTNGLCNSILGLANDGTAVGVCIVAHHDVTENKIVALQRAVIYSSKLKELTQPYYSNGYFTAINASHQAAGTFVLGGREYHYGEIQHACLWTGKQLKDLGTLPGGTISSVVGMNDEGDVIGQSQTSLLTIEQVRAHQSVTKNDLEAESELENSGPQAPAYTRGSHPFIYTHHAMHDLTGMLRDLSLWKILAVNGINNAGQIIATGIHTESGVNWKHALLLTPSGNPSLETITSPHIVDELNTYGSDGLPLDNAVRAQDVNDVKLLLAMGVNPNGPEDHKGLPVSSAVAKARYPPTDRSKAVEILRLLVQHHANTNIIEADPDPNRDVSLLEDAVGLGFYFKDESPNLLKDLVQLLLDGGADINHVSIYGTPLMKAIDDRDYDLANFLLDCKANVNISPSENQSTAGETALIGLLSNFRLDEKEEPASEMALFYRLLKEGANVNAQIKGSVRTPLWFACQIPSSTSETVPKQNIIIVKELLARGAKLAGDDASIQSQIDEVPDREVAKLLADHYNALQKTPTDDTTSKQ